MEAGFRRSEAYLEGMKTCSCSYREDVSRWSEAYLEGMKTELTGGYKKITRFVRSLPRRNENNLSDRCRTSCTWSEAYLEGMKTAQKCTFICVRTKSEAYLEGMKTCFPPMFSSTCSAGPKPTSKEWKLRIVIKQARCKSTSEAYLEGMKT